MAAYAVVGALLQSVVPLAVSDRLTDVDHAWDDGVGHAECHRAVGISELVDRIIEFGNDLDAAGHQRHLLHAREQGLTSRLGNGCPQGASQPLPRSPLAAPRLAMATDAVVGALLLFAAPLAASDRRAMTAVKHHANDVIGLTKTGMDVAPPCGNQAMGGDWSKGRVATGSEQAIGSTKTGKEVSIWDGDPAKGGDKSKGYLAEEENSHTAAQLKTGKEVSIWDGDQAKGGDKSKGYLAEEENFHTAAQLIDACVRLHRRAGPDREPPRLRVPR